MTASTRRDAATLSKLRHLYENMVNGAVRDTASAKRIAEGLLSPAIAELEHGAALTQAADAGAAEPVSIADVRRKFEEWYEAHQMPAESGWFVRDKDDPEDYAFSPTQDAWEGFAGAMGLGVDWWGRKVAAQQLQQAVAREREACAALAQECIRTANFNIAAAIRQQGTP